MSDDPDVDDCWRCPTLVAVSRFADESYTALARRGIHQLQSISATGIYGTDYGHRTVWDEFCHEVQNGPYELLEDAWQGTLDPILDGLVGGIATHEAVLLTIAAAWELEDGDPYFGTKEIPVAPNLIRQMLDRALASQADERDLEQFDPTDSES